MMLENHTSYSTKQLSGLVRAVYSRTARKYGTLRRWPKVVVDVVYAREPSDYRAYAEIGGRKIWLHLPRRRASTAMLTYLIQHELLHLYGHMHRDKVFPWHWPTNFTPWHWSVGRFGQTLQKERK